MNSFLDVSHTQWLYATVCATERSDYGSELALHRLRRSLKSGGHKKQMQMQMRERNAIIVNKKHCIVSTRLLVVLVVEFLFFSFSDRETFNRHQTLVVVVLSVSLVELEFLL